MTIREIANIYHVILLGYLVSATNSLWDIDIKIDKYDFKFWCYTNYKSGRFGHESIIFSGYDIDHRNILDDIKKIEKIAFYISKSFSEFLSCKENEPK